MSKLRIFARTFGRSLTDPAYYKDILSAKFFFSVKYFFALLFLSSLVLGISASIRVIKLIPQTPNFVENAKNFLVNTYPAELKLTLKDKKITSNVKEPYFIDLPSENRNLIQGFEHLIAINTGGGVDDFKKLNSTFVLTADSLIASDAGTGYKVIPLAETFSKFPDGISVDRNVLRLILNEATPYFLNLIPKILKVMAIVLITLYPLVRTVVNLGIQMVFLLPVSLILFVFARLVKRRISYPKTYQFCLHGMTIPVVLSFIFGSFSLYSWGVLVTWLIFFGFMVFVILKIKTSN